MKNILKFILEIVLLFLAYIVIFGNYSKVEAASLSVGSSSINVGESTTINVTIPDGYAAYEGTVSFDSNVISGSTTKVADANFSLGQVSNFSLTFKGVNSGSAKVSVNLTLCTSDGRTEIASGTGTITVNSVNNNDSKTSEESTPATPAPVQNTESNPVEKSTSEPSSTPAPVTESKPEPEPEPEPNFKSVNDTVYAIKSINVRSSWSTSSSKIGGLTKDQEVTRTGIGDNGWSRIKYNGKTAYVSTSLITTTKPEEKAEEQNNQELEENPEEVNTSEEQVIEESGEGTLEENKEISDEDIYQDIVSKVGTIPEVGINYNIYIYILVCIVSLVGILFIFRKI